MIEYGTFQIDVVDEFDRVRVKHRYIQRFKVSFIDCLVFLDFLRLESVSFKIGRWLIIIVSCDPDMNQPQKYAFNWCHAN